MTLEKHTKTVDVIINALKPEDAYLCARVMGECAARYGAVSNILDLSFRLFNEEKKITREYESYVKSRGANAEWEQ